jgi:hypothetical protein
MLHVYLYYYFGVILCIYRCICLFMFYIYVSTRALCVYILIPCNSKNLCDIAQLDVGYVTVCSAERMKAFSSVAWPSMGGQGCYNMVLCIPCYLIWQARLDNRLPDQICNTRN